jgi:hypothetical protein
MLRLGFFEGFKGRNIVLLGGTPNDISFLLTKLRQFVDSEETSLPIHDIAQNASNHPAQLYAIDGRRRLLSAYPSSSENSFIWDCTIDWEATQEMLENLIAPSGPPDPRALTGFHQFSIWTCPRMN